MYSDIDLTFGKNPITGDISRVTNSSAIKRSLKNLILTNFHEIPYEPRKGSGIRAMLFENFNPFMVGSIKRKIEEMIERYEPRVTVSELSLYAAPDANSLELKITYSITAYSSTETVSVILERTR